MHTRGGLRCFMDPRGQNENLADSFPRVGFVSTYPPTRCGLASFTSSLRNAMARRRGSHDGLRVVRVSNGANIGRLVISDEVVAHLDPGNAESLAMAARRLSDFDAVVLQHEFGIYGSDSGKAVLSLVNRIDAPLITTFHTVINEPTELQQRIAEHLVERSVFTVLLTRAARRLLLDRYRVDSGSTTVIPHGTVCAPVHQAAADRGDLDSFNSPPTLLTWGLIGPGKGLEWSLLAVDRLRRRFPGLRYVIAGRTHPKVVDANGEAYRIALVERVKRLGLNQTVEFIDEYLPRESLHELLRSAAAVILPYDSTEQVVSGVLVEAVAALVPVVATAFPHAVELAEEGTVLTVPHRSPQALVEAITGLLDGPKTRNRMLRSQLRLAPSFEWASVAAQYEQAVRDATRVTAAVTT